MQPQKPKLSKWLLISLIIIILAGAGYFGWYYSMGPGKKVKNSETSTPTKTDTKKDSTLKTYANEKYGFSLKYPSDFTLMEPESKDTSLATILFTQQNTYPFDEIKFTVKNNDFVDINAWGESYTNDENGGQWKTSDITMGGIKGKQLSNDASDYKTAVIKGDYLFQIDLTPSDVKDKAALVKIYKDMLISFKFNDSTSKTTDETANWKIYTKNIDFTVKYPENWVPEEGSDSVSFGESGKTYELEGTTTLPISIIISDANSQTLQKVAEARKEDTAPVDTKIDNIAAKKVVNHLGTFIMVIKNEKVYTFQAVGFGGDNAPDNIVQKVFNEMLPTFKFTN